MKLVYIVVGVVVAILTTVILIFATSGKTKKVNDVSIASSPALTRTQPTQPSQTSQASPPPAATKKFSFGQHKKAAHFESATPTHESILAAVPTNIVIDFNFDLAAPSEISLKNQGIEYGQGESIIDKNKVALRRFINPAAPDGLYEVTYKACWPDKSCHDGIFSFAIDKSKAKLFTDLTAQKEVTIRMSDILFKPMDIRVSKGTKITWINDEGVTHYVNTDSHPAHTYHIAQNSKALEKGANYSLTFDSAGIYPYHCSAHAVTMVGNIIVE